MKEKERVLISLIRYHRISLLYLKHIITEKS